MKEKYRDHDFKPSKELTECRNCGKDYEKPDDQCDSDDWCSRCLKWRDTPEGQLEMKKNRDKLFIDINQFEKSHSVVNDMDEVPF